MSTFWKPHRTSQRLLVAPHCLCLVDSLPSIWQLIVSEVTWLIHLFCLSWVSLYSPLHEDTYSSGTSILPCCDLTAFMDPGQTW